MPRDAWAVCSLATRESHPGRVFFSGGFDAVSYISLFFFSRFVTALVVVHIIGPSCAFHGMRNRSLVTRIERQHAIACAQTSATKLHPGTGYEKRMAAGSNRILFEDISVCMCVCVCVCLCVSEGNIFSNPRTQPSTLHTNTEVVSKTRCVPMALVSGSSTKKNVQTVVNCPPRGSISGSPILLQLRVVPLRSYTTLRMGNLSPTSIDEPVPVSVETSLRSFIYIFRWCFFKPPIPIFLLLSLSFSFTLLTFMHLLKLSRISDARQWKECNACLDFLDFLSQCFTSAVRRLSFEQKEITVNCNRYHKPRVFWSLKLPVKTEKKPTKYLHNEALAVACRIEIARITIAPSRMRLFRDASTGRMVLYRGVGFLWPLVELFVATRYTARVPCHAGN